MKSSVTEVQQDIDTFIQQDYAKIKEELKRLKEGKYLIEERLEQEETQCNSLHESKRLLSIQLKQKEIIERESTVADLKSELDCTNMKYNEKSEQMADLAADLSLKTSELVEKSFVLSKIEESFFESDDTLRIADKTIKEGWWRLSKFLKLLIWLKSRYDERIMCVHSGTEIFPI